MRSALVGFALGAIAIGEVSAQPAPPADSTPAGDVACVPACRAGYLCHQGACVSACNPPCGAAEVCTPAGECVSRCNPACDPGQTCTAAGECTGGATASPIAVVEGAGVIRPATARSAGILGIATAVVVGGLTTAIVINDDDDLGIPLGIAATAIGGVGIPLVAMRASSARAGNAAMGAPGMRLTGWVIYGLAMTDAVVLLGIAMSDGDVPAPLAGSVGLLGVTSAVFMTYDAFETAKQARALQLRAAVSAARDLDGDVVPTFGVACDF
jgi:hypothetical protein